ncbi:MAG TPA: hypothetical protein VHR66_05090 [Gemmataceae bacterium]|jgi:hypothetical protein|nr:hypothetical protein [Gemmataceae bacterium]
MIYHPWNHLKPKTRCRAFLIAAAIAVAMSATMLRLDAPLKERGGGIVAFELAGDLETALALMTNWGERGRLLAAFQLGLDYLFIVAYSVSISLGCIVAKDWWRRRWSGPAVFGPLIAWLVVLAGLLDCVENFALMRGLAGAVGEWWPILAFWCASIKFALLILAIAYFVGGGIVRVMWPC